MSTLDLSLIARDPKDARDLMILHLWDEWWSAGEIADVLRIGRGAVQGMVHRVHHDDPTALRRSPEKRPA